MKRLNDVYRIVSRVFFALNMLFALCFLIFMLIPDKSGKIVLWEYMNFSFIAFALVVVLSASACVYSYYALFRPLPALVTPILWFIVCMIFFTPFELLRAIASVPAMLTGNGPDFGIAYSCITSAFDIMLRLDGVFAVFALAVHICRSFAEKRERTSATAEE